MTTPLKVQDALAAAAAGGFYFNHGIIVITAIGCAESRLDSCGLTVDATARHTNTNGTIDRGWLQINSIHTNISDADCDDPVKAAAYAFNMLSKSGTDFTPWSTYNAGLHKPFIPLAYLAYAEWKATQDLASCQAALDQAKAANADLRADLDTANANILAISGQLSDATAKIAAAKAALA